MNEIEYKRQPKYKWYLGCRDEAEARGRFVARYGRQPKEVKPPDDRIPYWQVGPVDETPQGAAQNEKEQGQ